MQLSSTYKFHFQLQHKALFTLVHVLAMYCSHHQAATVLQRHKQHIVQWHGKYTHISFLQQLIDVQYVIILNLYFNLNNFRILRIE
jgi:hypothetical protein